MICHSGRLKIAHYHGDNGCFTDHGFVKHCHKQRQSISSCGVNAHFQNGLAKCKIRDLQEHTHTALLYVNQMAGDGYGGFVAICHAPLQPCYQLYSTIGHYPLSSQTIFRHICGTKAMTLSCLSLSDIYLGQYTTVRPRHVQKEVEGTSWSVFRALT